MSASLISPFLKSMAYRFPFENRAVLSKENYNITKKSYGAAWSKNSTAACAMI